MNDTTPNKRPKVSKWLTILTPAILIIIWFIVAGVGGPTFGKLSSVESNDQASFLPASAESTKVNNLQPNFYNSKSIPAIVLITSTTIISPRDYAPYAALAKDLGNIKGVEQPPTGQPTAIAGPIPSKNQKAIEYIVPISDTENVDKVIKSIRTTVASNKPSGTTSYVTGPAGLSADLVSAFGGIDGVLLYVAIGAVFIILLLVYRSIVLPFIVLFTAIFALSGAILLVYLMAKWGWIKLNGQSQGILSILVIGAATDYSLLITARYREAFETYEHKWDAITNAIKHSLEPIAASAATVVLALLCLLFSDLNSNRSLGPIAAIGIIFSFLAAITLLPAILYVFGRYAYWPRHPRINPNHPFDTKGKQATGLEGLTGLWLRIAKIISARPKLTWIVALIVLGLCMLGLPQLKATGVSQTALILSKSEAVDGQKMLGNFFDGGSGSPVVIVANQNKADQTLKAVEATSGISSAFIYSGPVNPMISTMADPIVVNNQVLIEATLKDQADSQAAEDVVKSLRTKLASVGSDALVGGVTAINLDTNTTAQNDLFKIIPIILIVILVILIILLRAIVAPLKLIASVVISYAATLGVAALVFNHLFNFPGADPSVPLFGFVFLVALGVDYNIFLMTRVREESLKIGTRPGILRGLGVTGSVITSAGVVLAATFAALSIIPILFLVEISFIVSFGVLLDTVIVRSLLVPAIAYDMGSLIWWPSRLYKKKK